MARPPPRSAHGVCKAGGSNPGSALCTRGPRRRPRRPQRQRPPRGHAPFTQKRGGGAGRVGAEDPAGGVGKEGWPPRSSPSLPLSQRGPEQRKAGRGQRRAVGLRPEAVGIGQVNLRKIGDGMVAKTGLSPGWAFLGASDAVFFPGIRESFCSGTPAWTLAFSRLRQRHDLALSRGNSGGAFADAPGSWAPGHSAGKLGLYLGNPSPLLSGVLVGNFIHSHLGP